MQTPLDMLSPTDFVNDADIPRDQLLINIHYLHDSGLVELMIGYTPQSFNATRITAKGIDLIENPYQFDMRFPREPESDQSTLSQLILLVENLVEDADLAPTNGETRHRIQRDVQTLRIELSRPAQHWRKDVLHDITNWLETALQETPDLHAKISVLRKLIHQL
jgi:hypothetical protein